MVARKLASMVISSDHCLPSQHLKRDHNDVADLLSFGPTRGDEKIHPFAADDPPNDVLSHRFSTFLPQITPNNFAISQLPREILSFVTLVVQTAESSMILKHNSPTKNETESGDDGLTAATPAASEKTPTSLEYPQMAVSFSANHSYPYIVSPLGTSQVSLLASVRSQWSEARSEMPQASWLRRFGTVSNGAPFTSKTAPSSSRPSDPC
jgi:hypothetical protein